jgi:DNA-binding CsgD family transcriptional regulator
VWEARPGSLWINAGPALIRVLQQTGGDDLTPAAIAASVTERAAATGAPWIEAHAMRCRGLADGDVGVLRQAAEGFAAIAERPDQLECLIDALGITTDAEEAVALRARADELATMLGSEDRMAALPSPVGAPARRVRRRAVRPVAGWGSLTVAEERVARLVAQGHSNAEAGAELFVSSRTVESHLRRIFAKLEIRKRVELAVLVSQLDDTDLPISFEGSGVGAGR